MAFSPGLSMLAPLSTLRRWHVTQSFLTVKQLQNNYINILISVQEIIAYFK